MRAFWLLLWIGVFALPMGGFAQAVRRAYELQPGGEYLALDRSIQIGKIWNFLNVPAKKGKQLGNQSMVFEKTYWNWGATGPEQMAVRQGEIYIFNWKNGGKRRDLLARFEYRQTRTREAVWSQVDFARQAHGTARSVFTVVGDDFAQHGRIYALRFTLVDGNRILAQAKSFIW